MKAIKLSIMALLLTFSIGAISCADHDDDESGSEDEEHESYEGRDDDD